MEVQLGLRVDGLPLIGSTDQEWKDVCEELLDIRPTEKAYGRGGRVNLSWVSSHFRERLPDDADDADILRATRAYMLVILGRWFFAD